MALRHFDVAGDAFLEPAAQALFVGNGEILEIDEQAGAGLLLQLDQFGVVLGVVEPLGWESGRTAGVSMTAFSSGVALAG